MTMNTEKIVMPGIAVALITEDREQSVVLRSRLESTNLARTVLSHVGVPAGPSDAILRQLQDQHAEVVLVDIDPQNPHRAIRTIELIHANISEVTIFAVGDMNQPTNIVSAMRAGAREFLDRAATREALIEAFTRFSASLSRAQRSSTKARVLTFLNAKGGAGTTTTAVNTAVALQQSHGDVVLVDFAPIGHTSLHLNLRPQFGVLDALQNLHRLDVSLLDGLMTPTKEGLHLLAGPQQPYPTEPTPGELARLFDLLVNHYRFVIVDASSRLDPTTRLLSDLSNAVLVVAQTDVVSLWSAGRIHTFLEEGTGRDRLRIVLNRYKKIPGFTEEDVEQVTNCKVLWKVPNAFQSVSPSIDHGTPIVLQDGPEISRSYRALAATLAEASSNSNGSPDLVFSQESARKKAPGRLSLSPLRAGQ